VVLFGAGGKMNFLWKFWPLRSSRQYLTLRNTTSDPLEVMVEMTPDRYVLQPDDEITIEAAHLGRKGATFEVCAYKGGLQVFDQIGKPTAVWINGSPAKPNWDPSP
jgi:hypothetical protein